MTHYTSLRAMKNRNSHNNSPTASPLRSSAISLLKPAPVCLCPKPSRLN